LAGNGDGAVCRSAKPGTGKRRVRSLLATSEPALSPRRRKGASARSLAETTIRRYLQPGEHGKMDRAAEINILKTLLHYIDTKTTAMAEAPWHNEVTAYTCPQRHKREENILIRKRPLVMGLSCDWPAPGAYRTDDFAGVPILTVRGSDGKLRAFLNVCRHRGAKVARAVRAPSPAPITAGPTATTAACAACPKRRRPFPACGRNDRA
jgi:Rieske [2Fe-2S] domain